MCLPSLNRCLSRAHLGEPEWIEFYNATEDAVDVQGWKVSNRNSRTKHNISRSTHRIDPGSYFLVTRDSTALVSVHPTISVPALVAPSLPTYFLSNNGDAVVISDARGQIIDSVLYQSFWGGGGGSSLERVSLSERSNDSSNWGTTENPEGSTPGVKNSLTPKDFDLAVGQITFDSAQPIVGEDVIVQAMVANRGLRSADRFQIAFYEDLDRDSIGREDEVFFLHEELHPLVLGDSLLYSSQLFNISEGIHQIIVTITFSEDEDTTNNSKIVYFRTGLPRRSIVVNEIMYAPVSGQPEWLELFNTSEYAVDLNGWTLANNAATRKYRMEVSDKILRPQMHAVITKDSSAFLTGHGHVTGLVLEVARLPTFFLNNSGDEIVLRDERDFTMDSLAYLASWGGEQGLSLERIDALGSSTDSSNWGSSVDSLGSTPARKNSIVPLDIDMAIRRVVLDPPFPPIGGDVSFVVVAQNVGFQTMDRFEVQLAVDDNFDGLAQQLEVRRSIIMDQVLAWRDSSVMVLDYGPIRSEERRMIVLLNAVGDQDLQNNQSIEFLRFRHRDRSVVINEIMYDPLPGRSEYVEILNRSAYDISLDGWTVSDSPKLQGSAKRFALSSTPLFLPKGGYAVLASDSSVFELLPEVADLATGVPLLVVVPQLSLNNDGDAVILKDISGFTIDSVSYLPRWHNPEIIDGTGRALERISPEAGSNDSRNWSTSANRQGGTPGRQNSIFTSIISPDMKVSFSPNPFSPDGDGFEDFTVMHYNLPLTTATLRVKIYDSVGRLVRILSHGNPSGSLGDIIWDGFDDDRQRLRMGIYIVLLEALDSVGGSVETAKSVVVLAGKL